ncbi:MAG: L,D-transpeptidase [Chlamydiae bacterium]|nr:L,D-transpeptidase [Chlamydiota bacterium]
MSAPKVFFVTAVLAFSVIGVVSVVKKKKSKEVVSDVVVSEKKSASESFFENITPVAVPLKESEKTSLHIPKNIESEIKVEVIKGPQPLVFKEFPSIDRTYQLFNTGQNKLPIVETVVYSSAVPWLKGRPAWVSDYAAYYNTSKHFIARSLNGKPDYNNQTVASGSKFNVFKKDKKIHFHLLVDTNQLKMGLYYYDLETKERLLIKTYSVGLGRVDKNKPSGSLTPLGTYLLGDKIAIYSPGIMGLFHDQKTEMIRVFGTRWIPFGQSLEGATESAKGYGIHGAPWIVDSKTSELVENRESVGKFESDGCIRLLHEDVEELFSIIITKPTFVHIVKDFQDANLPGVEVATPTR